MYVHDVLMKVQRHLTQENYANSSVLVNELESPKSGQNENSLGRMRYGERD